MQLLPCVAGCGHGQDQLKRELSTLRLELRQLRQQRDSQNDKLTELDDKVLLLKEGVKHERKTPERRSQISIPKLPVVQLNDPTPTDPNTIELPTLRPVKPRRQEPLRRERQEPPRPPIVKRQFTVSKEPSVSDFHKLRFVRITEDGRIEPSRGRRRHKLRRQRIVIPRQRRVLIRAPHLRVVRWRPGKRRGTITITPVGKRQHRKVITLAPKVRDLVSRVTPEKDNAVAVSLYNRGLAAYRGKRVDHAITLFKQYIVAYPDNSYTDNAYYWLGECYYDKKDFDKAMAAFLAVLKKFPLGNKVPAAMLKIALTMKRRGEHNNAKSYLFKVIEVYPMSDAAKVAVSRMQEF